MTMIATNNTARAQQVPAINYSGDTLASLEQTAQEYSLANTSTLGRFQAAFTLAQGMRRLRDAITDEMMDDVVTLMGTSLGFKTDKDTKGDRYPVDVVRDCFIEATLRGARLIGNEFNIIASRCYLTKEFYMRALGEVPGVTNVQVAPGIPGAISEGLCGVRVTLKWLRHGEPEELASADDKKGRGFVVKYYGKLEADQVIGKALRKAFKAAYEQVTGSQLESSDDDFVDGEAVGGSRPADEPRQQSRTSALAQRVGAKPTESASQPLTEVSTAVAAPADVDPTQVPIVASTVQEFEATFIAIAKAHQMDEQGAAQFLARTKLVNSTARLSVRESILQAFANGALGEDGTLPA